MVCIETCEKYKQFYNGQNNEGIHETKSCNWLVNPKRGDGFVETACAITDGFNGMKPASEVCFMACGCPE